MPVRQGAELSNSALDLSKPSKVPGQASHRLQNLILRGCFVVPCAATQMHTSTCKFFIFALPSLVPNVRTKLGILAVVQCGIMGSRCTISQDLHLCTVT